MEHFGNRLLITRVIVTERDRGCEIRAFQLHKSPGSLIRICPLGFPVTDEQVIENGGLKQENSYSLLVLEAKVQTQGVGRQELPEVSRFKSFLASQLLLAPGPLLALAVQPLEEVPLGRSWVESQGITRAVKGVSHVNETQIWHLLLGGGCPQRDNGTCRCFWSWSSPDS